MGPSRSTVHAIVGPDSFLAEEALEERLATAVGEDRTDAVQVFHGDEAAWPRVLDAARTPSLFAPRRAVVVRSAEALRGPEDDVAAYLDDPPPGVILILMAAKPDKRRAVWKRILEKAVVVAAQPLKGRRLRDYVAERVRRRGLTLSAEGLEELIERVGQDLRRLMGEVDKLEAFAGGLGAVSAEDVAAVLGRGLARPLYRLGDSLGERRAVEALEFVEEVLEEGEEPVVILGVLHRALRQLFSVRGLQQARVPRDEMISRLRIERFAFKLPALLEAARRWSDEDFRAAFRALERADRRLKRGASAQAALGAAVVEACRGAGARPGSPPGR